MDAGKLERISRGIYTIADGVADKYALLQVRCSKAVFSYGPALYLLGMSDRVPHVMDMTVGQGANVRTVTKNTPKGSFQ